MKSYLVVESDDKGNVKYSTYDPATGEEHPLHGQQPEEEEAEANLGEEDPEVDAALDSALGGKSEEETEPVDNAEEEAVEEPKAKKGSNPFEGLMTPPKKKKTFSWG